MRLEAYLNFLIWQTRCSEVEIVKALHQEFTITFWFALKAYKQKIKHALQRRKSCLTHFPVLKCILTLKGWPVWDTSTLLKCPQARKLGGVILHLTLWPSRGGEQREKKSFIYSEQQMFPGFTHRDTLIHKIKLSRHSQRGKNMHFW